MKNSIRNQNHLILGATGALGYSFSGVGGENLIRVVRGSCARDDG